MIVSLLLISLFILSGLFAPWWSTLFFGIVVLVRGEFVFMVPLIGLLIDVSFGWGQSLFGIPFFYTVFFSLATILSLVLRKSLLD